MLLVSGFERAKTGRWNETREDLKRDIRRPPVASNGRYLSASITLSVLDAVDAIGGRRGSTQEEGVFRTGDTASVESEGLSCFTWRYIYFYYWKISLTGEQVIWIERGV